MPRSKDGRWDRQCARCGKIFEQRRTGQEFCSQNCSNKEFPGAGGSKPAVDLEPRDCANPECNQRFQPYRSNQYTCSKTCYKQLPSVRERNNAARRTPEHRRRKNAWRRADPGQVQRVRTYNRKTQLARYGLTPEEYDRVLAEQYGRCKLCDRLPNPNGTKAAKYLHVDHDHETGQKRDLLCSTCNTALGLLHDDPVLLRAAADYIERHRAVVTT